MKPIYPNVVQNMGKNKVFQKRFNVGKTKYEFVNRDLNSIKTIEFHSGMVYQSSKNIKIAKEVARIVNNLWRKKGLGRNPYHFMISSGGHILQTMSILNYLKEAPESHDKIVICFLKNTKNRALGKKEKKALWSIKEFFRDSGAVFDFKGDEDLKQKFYEPMPAGVSNRSRQEIFDSIWKYCIPDENEINPTQLKNLLNNLFTYKEWK